MKVLLTSFEPFGKSDKNSSWEVAQGVPQNIDGRIVSKVVLPVNFNRVGAILYEAIQTHHPDYILMLGQSGREDKIRLERVALNMMDASSSDNDGNSPSEQPINLNDEKAYFTNMPIKRIWEDLKNKDLPVKISNSCGLYVCNCAYYNALSYCIPKGIKTMFIHLPYYKGQTGIDENNATLDLKIMTETINAIIKIL